MTNSNWVPDGVDAERPSAARIYDYLLGGGHNFAVDREMAANLLAIEPNIRRMMMLNRAFLRRAVLFLMSQGVRQFLDLGSGIPTVGNVHEIAHQVDPAAKVVYVDYEDVAVAHSEIILADVPNAEILQADATDAAAVLAAPQTRTLDFEQPVGLLAVTLFHYVSDEKQPVRVIETYKNALAAGSFVALTHGTSDFFSRADDVVDTMRHSQDNIFLRTKDQVQALFGGLDLVDPGVVPTSWWRPESPDQRSTDPGEDGQYAGVAHKG